MPTPELPGFLLLLAGSMLLVIGLHEAGHLLAGRLVGFAPRLYVVGPLQIEWTDGKAQLSLNRNLGLAGGLAASAPRTFEHLPRRMAVIVAGGPVTSLLIGLLGVSASLLLAGGESVLPFCLLLIGAMSLAIGLATLVPSRSGGFLSDGGRLLRIWRGGPQVSRDTALWAIIGLEMGPERPANWPPELLEQVTALTDDSYETAAAQVIAYTVALDRGDTEPAKAHLAAALALIDHAPPATRPGFYLEEAYMAARVDGDPQRARAALDRSKGGMLIPPYSRLRAESAVVLAEGDAGQAAALARKGLDLLAAQRPTSTTRFEGRLLTDLLTASQP